MYKKIRSHPTTLNIYSKKISAQNLFSIQEIENKKIDFKNYLEREFKASKNYKSELKMV